MANFVVIGVPGDPQLYIADLGAGTITPLNAPGGSDLGVADQLRNAGATIVKGVNLAVAVGTAANASAGKFDDIAASGKFEGTTASGKFDN
ncbi:hypothetical protein PY650_00540 [Rhizobium calliandrae]|uniref:Uncharacterized protein n=1 Tax=Rhizobium calliandrae TaxID=1312182 RepID=A0ABT7K6D9_9HYPH|nr:hypothetical protein [Rhizobium calliandrae]MDL2404166.1 hypothetical protein [Rhizobium calliandrae]